MIKTLKNSNLNSVSIHSLSTRSKSLFSEKLEHHSLQKSASFGQESASFATRSRLEIGEFGRVFTTSGSVRRNFDDVFRFNLSNRRRLRIYLGNEFSNPRSNNRRMTVNLLDDRTLRRVTSANVTPTGINAITRTLNPGTYRIVVSTQSNDRGRYFMDMVRL